MQQSGVTRMWEVARLKNCKMQFSTSSQPDKNLYVCVCVCVVVHAVSK